MILLLADIHIRVTADGYVRFDCEALKLRDFREDLRCTRSRSGHAGSPDSAKNLRIRATQSDAGKVR